MASTNCSCFVHYLVEHPNCRLRIRQAPDSAKNREMGKEPVMEFLKSALSDAGGNVSHARIIAMLVGITASIIMWKIMLMGELNTTYFLYYLGYGVIHMNVSKALDVLNNLFSKK